MTSTDLKAHLALLKDVVSDTLSTLNENEARTAFDVSHIAQPREATFRFVFNDQVTMAGLHALLTRISWKHEVDPGYVMISTEDYSALPERITMLHVSNDYTGTSARLIVSPDIPPGEVVFGVLYAPGVPSVVDGEAPRFIGS